MARSHGILKIEIWDVGSDFRTLTRNAQRAYALLISQPQINNCGVLPYLPHRWGRMAADDTVEAFETAIAELAAHEFVIVDETTRELLVRTFIKHDRIWKQPNLVKRARKELHEIESDTIRGYLETRHPWLVDDTVDAAAYEAETARTSQTETPSGTPSERGSETPSGTPPRPRDARAPSARDRATHAHRPSPIPTRDGAATRTAAGTAHGLTAAAPTGEQAGKLRTFNRTQAETLIRNVGWMDPHPDQLLADYFDHIPDTDLRELLELAESLQTAELAASPVPVVPLSVRARPGADGLEGTSR